MDLLPGSAPWSVHQFGGWPMSRNLRIFEDSVDRSQHFWVGPAGLRFHAASDCFTEVLLGFVIFFKKQFNGLTELLVKFDDDTDFEKLFWLQDRHGNSLDRPRQMGGHQTTELVRSLGIGQASRLIDLCTLNTSKRQVLDRNSNKRLRAKHLNQGCRDFFKGHLVNPRLEPLPFLPPPEVGWMKF